MRSLPPLPGRSPSCPPNPPSQHPLRGVFVDWYQVRTRSPIEDVRAAVSDAFGADGLHSVVEWHREPGRGGFVHWDVISLGGMRLGHVAWGGKSVADWLHFTLTGHGCGMVADWTAFDAFIRARLLEFSHRRVDLAVDFLDGSMTYEHIEASWHLGGFDPLRGSRPSRDRQGYPETGRTFYVGTRSSSDRFHRGYEKGMKEGRHPWGESFDPRWWFRLECEFKPCNGPVPLGIVSDRDAFFAGAAPLYGQILAGVTGQRGQRDPLRDIAAEIADAVRNLRRMSGPALSVLRDVYGTDKALLDALTSGAVPSPRLVEAGARILNRSDLAEFGV